MNNPEELLNISDYTRAKYDSYLYLSYNDRAYLMLSSYVDCALVEVHDADNIIVCIDASASAIATDRHIMYEYKDGVWNDITSATTDRYPISVDGTTIDEVVQLLDWMYSKYDVPLGRSSSGSLEEFVRYGQIDASELSVMFNPRGYLGSPRARYNGLYYSAITGSTYPADLININSKTNCIRIDFVSPATGQLWKDDLREGDVLLISAVCTVPIKYVFDTTPNFYTFEPINEVEDDGTNKVRFYKVIVSKNLETWFHTNKNIYVAFDSPTTHVYPYVTVSAFDKDVVQDFRYNDGSLASTIGASSYRTTAIKPTPGNYIWCVYCLTDSRYNPVIVDENNSTAMLLSSWSGSGTTYPRFAVRFDDVPDKYMSTGNQRRFVIVRDNYQRSEMVVDGVEVVYKENDEKYILRSEGRYYTIVNGSLKHLDKLDSEQLTSAIIMENGFDDIPVWDVIKDLIDPIIYFHNKKGASTKHLSAEMVAIPRYAFVETSDIYVARDAIERITSIVFDVSDDVVITCSVDRGNTWFYIDEYFQTVELEDPDSRVGNTPDEFMTNRYIYFKNMSYEYSVRFRVLLTTENSYAKGVSVVYNNGNNNSYYN